MKFRSAALSDIGKLRPENQDRCLWDEAAGLFGVADGVSGLPGGAAAAEAAAGEVLSAFRALGPESEPDLAGITRAASHAVSRRGLAISPLVGIATTLTFGCVRSGRLKIAHVGDSRCYAWRGGSLHCLTEDHSVENEARRLRREGRTMAYSPVNRSALVRCLGPLPPAPPDLIEEDLQAGDRYLFCTDGVSRVVPARQMGEILAGAGDPAQVLRSLIAAALRLGGPDNASGVLLFIDEV